MSTYKYIKQLGYNSIINFVNIGDNLTVDQDRLNIVLSHMFNHGWKELRLYEVEDITPSTQFRYLLKDEDGIKFRTGGFFIKYYPQDEDPDQTDSYILYSSHLKGVNVTAQCQTLYRVYIYQKPKKIIEKMDKVIQYKRPYKTTNYPVCMIDSNKNTVVVYYGRTQREREEFMQTTKFKNASKYGWEFSD